MKNIKELKKRYAYIVKAGGHMYPVAVGAIEAIIEECTYSSDEKVERIQEVLELINALQGKQI